MRVNLSIPRTFYDCGRILVYIVIAYAVFSVVFPVMCLLLYVFLVLVWGPITGQAVPC